MISIRLGTLITALLCCHLLGATASLAKPMEPNDEPPNRTAARKAAKALSAIGIEYELIVDDYRPKDKSKHTAFPYTIFRNDDSVQILHELSLSEKGRKLAPLDTESVREVGPLARSIHLATLKPSPEYATYNFATPIVGRYTYFKSNDSRSFFHTTTAPVLVDLSKFQSQHYPPSELNLIFDAEQTWIPMPEISDSTFAIVIRSVDLKTKQGNETTIKPMLIFTFKSTDSAIPSEAWIAATWTVEGKPFLIPKSASSTKWTFGDWKRDESGNAYPSNQVEEQQSTNVTMLDMLDESTGWLAKLASGKFETTPKTLLRKEIKVKNWMPISPDQNLFLKPEDFVAVRDSNTNELYISGVEKEESDRILEKSESLRREFSVPPPE